MKDGVYTIRLDREHQHNRIDPSDISALREAIARIAVDQKALALVITGSGTRTFSSGYTLSALADGRMDGSFEAFLNEVERLPVVTICALNGSVYGGATDLALCCDIRIGVDNARMIMPAARIGLHYYPDGMRRYAQELGLMQAKRLMLTGMAIDAAEMVRIGFLTERVAPPALPGRISQYLDALMECDTGTVRSMKRQFIAIGAGDKKAASDKADYERSLRSPVLASRISDMGKR
ncbi:enoyl-CoA hydratase/isomerase family protein [Paraburkholderia humisilvae]